MSESTPPSPLPLLQRRWLRMLLCVLAGVVMALAFLPYDISILVWVGLLPLLYVLWSRPMRFWAAFGYGWLYGMGWYCVSFWWIHEVGAVFRINEFLFLGVAFIPLMSYYALFPAIWAGIASTLLRPRLGTANEPASLRATKTLFNTYLYSQKCKMWKEWAMLDLFSTLRSALGLAALWVCIEWLRAQGTLGFSWNSMGMALYDGLSLVQWAEFIGTAALSFFPVLFAVICYGAIRRCYLHMKAVSKPCRPWDFYAVLLLIFGLFMGGLSLAQRYSAYRMLNEEGIIPIPVLAVQNNLDQVKKITEPRHLRGANFHEYIAETKAGFQYAQKETLKQAIKHPEYAFTQQLPLWVIWPESALPYPFWRENGSNTRREDYYAKHLYFDQERGIPYLRDQVSKMGSEGFVLFTGVDEYNLIDDEHGEPRLGGMYNSMAIIKDDFSSISSVSKQHLMPFGEYIPLAQDIEWIGQTYANITGTQTGDGIIPGEGTEPIPVALPNSDNVVSVIPAICYEDTVGGLVRQFARQGAQVIVNISNDAWFHHSACGEQQARNAAFRCIELRRPMVRAANQGVTCAIGPNGGFIHELRDENGTPWLRGSSYAVLPLDPEAGLTIYAQFGDWAVLLCFLIVLTLTLQPFIWNKLTKLAS